MAGWIVWAVLAGWIRSYRCGVFAVYRWILLSLDFAVSLDIAGTGTGSYRIIMAGCKDGTDGTDRTDGNDGNDGQMGLWREWGGRLLAPAGTGATEQECHHWLDGY